MGCSTSKEDIENTHRIQAEKKEKKDNSAAVAETAHNIIESMWNKYDVDGNGSLEYEELKKFAWDTLKKIKGADAPMPTDEELTATFKKYDVDGNGHVSKAEMTDFITKSLGGGC